MISEKIRPYHLQRKALLYVRQSSAHQVLHNRESSALQYAMRDRLVALGWSQIEVIDDDLGRSAAGGTQRSGFERMVTEVCLGKAGAVCAREVSHFARTSRDWQQLIEMCRVVDTVLVDQETIYAPRHGNDRLLLRLVIFSASRHENRFRENCQTHCLISQLLGYNVRNRYCKRPGKCLETLTSHVQLLLDCPSRPRAGTDSHRAWCCKS